MRGRLSRWAGALSLGAVLVLSAPAPGYAAEPCDPQTTSCEPTPTPEPTPELTGSPSPSESSTPEPAESPTPTPSPDLNSGGCSADAPCVVELAPDPGLDDFMTGLSIGITALVMFAGLHVVGSWRR